MTLSGLLNESVKSTINISQAEELFLRFLKDHVPRGECPLAGNTIYMDKLFMMKYLPKVADYLHYHLIDVSSINELFRRWYPNLKIPWKKKEHRATNDILESIQELKYYKDLIFKPNSK